VRSARRRTYSAGLVLTCAAVLAIAQGGCATTQETAALKQAESKRILEARQRGRQAKPHDHDGSQKR
jgi:hypothetical protein